MKSNKNRRIHMKSTKFYRNAAMLLLAGATIIPQCLAVPAMADSSTKPSAPAASCAASKDSLNNYLWDLHYDKTNILARHGETINNKFSSDSFNKNGEFVVVEHQKKNITNTTSNLSVTSANNDRVYPGA
ncbi:alveolysin, partial [Bifidobacteriaceae bacterium WP022]